jgi:hypothetical protein
MFLIRLPLAITSLKLSAITGPLIFLTNNKNSHHKNCAPMGGDTSYRLR